MKKLRLKVCGLRDNIGEVATLQPDYAGFIFYSKSPRYVGDNFEMPALPESLKKVGIFVNESLKQLEFMIEKYRLDFVQLHGTETTGYCKKLNSQGIGVIKSFAMEEGFDFSILEHHESTVDYFLFDTKTTHYGGSGKAFNWELLRDYHLDKEYFLSGGIGLDNLADLDNVDMSKIHALDVNSRFELRPGLKDTGVLQALLIKIDSINSKNQLSKNK